MNVAISGDRSSCLAQEIAPGAYIVALARGFGCVGGEPIAQAVLAALRTELERHLRGERLVRASRRPRGIVRALSNAYSRVNGDIHARGAGNDDYVTAACSITAAVVMSGCAYLAHAGATAAYLLRDGSAVALTKDDAIETSAGRVLTRALGSAPVLQTGVSTFTLNDGDELILAARHYTAGEEHARQWEREQSLIVQYTSEPVSVADSVPGSTFARVARTLGATVLFYALLCLR